MMKQFLYTLLRFCILPVLLLVLLEGSIAWQKKNLFSEKRLDRVFANSGARYNWITKVGRNNKVILLGSSSVKYGLSCEQLNELSHDSLAFINLGEEARDPIESYFILKQLDLSGVRSVYFALDPWIYSRNYYRNRNSYLYLDLDPVTAANYSSEHDPRLFPKRYKSLFASLLPSSAKTAEEQPIPAGFGSATLTRPPTNFNDPVYNKFRVDKYGWSELQFEYLQKMALLCQSRNISFKAFYTPKRSDFIADYKKNCIQIHAAFLENLKATGFTARIVGSFEQLQSYGDRLFADAYHLNGKGQDVYAEIFYTMTNE